MKKKQIKIFIIILIMTFTLFTLRLTLKTNDKFNIENINKILLLYLIFINSITFIIFAIDKYKSIKNKWRIEVSTLINLCLIGGSIGGIIAMYLFHHKTKQITFFLGIPLIILIQIFMFIYFTYII